MESGSTVIVLKEKESKPPEKKLNKVALARSIFLLFAFTGQFVMLGRVGRVIPTHMYFMVLWITIPTCIVFSVIYVIEKPKEASWWTIFHAGDFTKALLVLSLFFSFNYILVGFGDPYTPTVLQAILAQTPLLGVFICSRFMLGKHLSSKQVIAAFTIFFGILISFIPKLTGSMSGGNGFWIFLFGLGNFILAPANVLLEYYFKTKKDMREEVSVSKVLFQISGLMVTILALVWFLNVTPGFGNMSLNDFSLNMNQAFTCAFARHGAPSDDCDYALFFLLLFFIFVAGALYVQTLTDKEDDASWGMIVSTALAPVVAEFCFASTFIMGPYRESLNPYVVLAVLLIFGGTVLYKYDGLTGNEEEHEIKPALFVRWLIPSPYEGYSSVVVND